MEPRLSFVTQKDVTDEQGCKVRYISDSMIEINGRIDHRAHANAIRRMIYWKRRNHTIPVILCKRGVKGAFKLSHVAIRGLPRVGLQFANFMVVYLSLYFGWTPTPAAWGILPTLLLQFSSSFTPYRPREMGPEGFVAYEYVDDGPFADPWLDVRPWTLVEIWGRGLQ